MARSRNIKPGFFCNEILVELPFEYRLLFIGLWTVADRAGRFQDRPTRIKMELFPADSVDVEAGLRALHDNGFITRYSVDGCRYCQVLAWDKHQNPHIKEATSTIPAPDASGASTVQTPDKNSASPADSLIPDSLNLIPDSRTLDQQADRSTETRFEEFWAAYPRKVGKEDARKAFVKLNPDAGLLAVMLDAVATSAKSEHWAKDKQFIPHPATWIRGKRWQDEEGGSCDDSGIPDYAVGAV